MNKENNELTFNQLQEMVVTYSREMTTMQDDVKTLKHDVQRIEKMQVTETTMLKMYEKMEAIQSDTKRVIEYNENNYKKRREHEFKVDDAVATSHEALNIVKSHPAYVNYETKQSMLKMPFVKVAINIVSTVVIVFGLSIPSTNLSEYIKSNGETSAFIMSLIAVGTYAFEVWKKKRNK